MITSNDPTSEAVFRLPIPESIAGYDDDQLKHSAGRIQLEEIKSFQRYSAARLTAVFVGAVVVAIVKRNEAKAWDIARVRISTEIQRRRGDPR